MEGVGQPRFILLIARLVTQGRLEGKIWMARKQFPLYGSCMVIWDIGKKGRGVWETIVAWQRR